MKSFKVLLALAISLAFAACDLAPIGGNAAFEADSRAFSGPAIKLIGARTRMFAGSGQNYIARLSGDIDLENIAYAKTVKVVYSTGSAWLEAPARYVKSLGNNREHWAFEIALGSYLNVGDPRAGYTGNRVVTQFALKYEVGGQTYWDNNGGYNVDYRVSSEGSGAAPYAPAAFGKANAVLTYASYTDYPNTYFRGTVAVRKFGVNRSLRVVFSCDGWKTVKDAQYAFVMDSGEGYDTWFFSDFSDQGAISPDRTYEFAIEYIVDGVSYWDNNVFSNYRVGTKFANEPKYY